MPLKYTVFQLRTSLFVKTETENVLRNDATIHLSLAFVVENMHEHNWRRVYSLKFEEKNICIEWQED